MKKFIFLLALLAGSGWSQTSSPWDYEIALGDIAWYSSDGATLKTTISGTDSSFSEVFFDVYKYDSLFVTVTLPASDSCRVKFSVLEGHGSGTVSGTTWVPAAVDFDSIVSIGVQQKKSFNLKDKVGPEAQFARIRIRAYNTAGVPTANGVTSGGQPTLTRAYTKTYGYRKPNTKYVFRTVGTTAP